MEFVRCDLDEGAEANLAARDGHEISIEKCFI
jgi:hypothetical protein